MVETGYRYQELYWAGKDNNWKYAGYQVEKIKLAIENGLERRPKRAKSVEYFMTYILPEINKALEKKDTEIFNKNFQIMDYWYAASLTSQTATSGGLHGYLMDNPLDWLRTTIQKLERDGDIDHIFITQHTPAFPNGGHSGDDVWYSGDNTKRPWIGGKPVEKGIIERRDEYLDIQINESKKTVTILTGDEHNYDWLKLTHEVPIYPEIYPYKKLNVSRSIYQINNGAAGALSYAQEVLPWSKFTQSFSVENALCFFM